MPMAQALPQARRPERCLSAATLAARQQVSAGLALEWQAHLLVPFV
jgi:hypothetical protein